MIYVDYGSKLIKWFDGKSFGKVEVGEEKLNLSNAYISLSSKTTFVKETFYPVCDLSKLKKIILNDVSSELLVPEENLSVAFCVKEKKEKGCNVLIFVNRKEELELKNVKLLTVDLVAGISGAFALYGKENFTLIDAGASKIGVINFKEGRVSSVEVLRSGYPYLKKERSYFKERLLPLLEGEKVVLIGGGALDKDFLALFPKSLEVEVPEISPFNEETPLYFNVFGLYNLRKSPCKAFFYRSSLFSSSLFEKQKRRVLAYGVTFGVALFLLALSQGVQGFACKKRLLKEETNFKEQLRSLLGKKIVAPDIQLSQELERLKRRKKLLAIDQPSVLVFLGGISKSVAPGINVYKVKGSADSGTFTLKGRAVSQEALTKFVKKLKRNFKEVSNLSTTTVSNGLSFTLTVSGVKSERKD